MTVILTARYSEFMLTNMFWLNFSLLITRLHNVNYMSLEHSNISVKLFTFVGLENFEHIW